MSPPRVTAGWVLDRDGALHAGPDAGVGLHAGEAPVGGPSRLAMKAPVNAHDHGRAITTLAAGVLDTPLELWIPATRALPVVPPLLEARVAFGRMARAGIAETQVCHDAFGSECMIAGAVALASAARAVGIRAEIAMPVLDRHLAGYAAAEAAIERLSLPDRAAVSAWDIPVPPVAEQIAAVEEAALLAEGAGVTVAFHAVGLPWCSQALFAAVAARSAETGRRVFMHLLETPRQRRHADAEHGGMPLDMLDKVGLLSPRLACAHGVHLRVDETELLAARGVRLSVNTSSNLRLGSGVAPVPVFRAAGLAFGLGLDSFGWADAPDPWEEARLVRLIHRGAAPEPGLSNEAALTALTRGARSDDVVLLDLDRLAPDRLEGADLAELVLARARTEHVTDLIVGGRVVLRDGVLTGIDLAEAERELLAAARTAPRGADPALVARHAQALRAALDVEP